ncbi:hypothetical protein OU997_08740 [Pseudomonas sp. SL4(2022)]|nr:MULTISPECIES: hypothetical protein [unclassified Pseudomonas]WAC46228.1 hypothetical protein OU997_08740 [Pseudomonas sp. SL4(2022)]
MRRFEMAMHSIALMPFGDAPGTAQAHTGVTGTVLEVGYCAACK